MKYILILLVFCSCGSGHHLRRAERFKKKMDEQIAKAIDKGAQVKVDTVFKEIQVVVPEIRTDTVFKEKEVGDTVTIIKEKLKIKYVKLPGDSVFIQGECEADTVYKTVPIATNTKFEAKPYMKWWQIAGCILFALVVGLTVGRFMR